MSTNKLQRILIGVAGAFAAAFAQAQDFPSKQLRIVVPYPAGSGPDIVARGLANVMPKHIGQNVIVENKGGGGGVPAILDIKNAPHDGHSLLWPDSSQWGVFPALRSDLPYDPIRDFAPVGMVYNNALYFFVKPDSPIKGVPDLIARAKEKPGALRYGVTGVGGIMHIAGEAWRLASGIDVTVVPFGASQQSLVSVMNGDLDFCLTGWSTIKNLHRAGKVRAIASTGPSRDRYSPDVPSVTEFGLKNFDFQADIGIAVWTGTPKPVIDKLNAALHASQKDQAFLDVLKRLEYNVVVTTPEEFGAKIKSDLEKFRAVAKAANIKVQ